MWNTKGAGFQCTLKAHQMIRIKGSCQAYRTEVGSKAQTLITGFREKRQQASRMDEEVKIEESNRGPSLPILIQTGVDPHKGVS